MSDGSSQSQNDHYDVSGNVEAQHVDAGQSVLKKKTSQNRELIVDDRLRLVEPSLDHAEASLSWVSQPDVVQFMGADFSVPSIEGERRRIRDVIDNDDEYSWMIELDGKIIGNVCVNSIRETTEKFDVRAGNLTILIGSKEEWGKGLGMRVCSAVLDWAFEEGGFEAMAARALQENIASIRTLQKAGFVETGTEPFDGLINGKASVWRTFRMERR